MSRVVFQHITTPGPDTLAGQMQLYAKTDGRLWVKNGTQAELPVTSLHDHAIQNDIVNMAMRHASAEGNAKVELQTGMLHCFNAASLAGLDLSATGTEYDFVSGGGGSSSTDVIVPFAYAAMSDTAGSGGGSVNGTGCSWTWDSNNQTFSVTFDTARANTNYTIVTDEEFSDASGRDMIPSGKATTGFDIDLYQGYGPTGTIKTVLVYDEDPTQSISATGVPTGYLKPSTSDDLYIVSEDFVTPNTSYLCSLMLFAETTGVATPALNSEIKGALSRDGGSSFIDMTLEQKGQWATGDFPIYVARHVSMSLATSLKYRVEIEKNTSYKLHGVAMSYRDNG